MPDCLSRITPACAGKRAAAMILFLIFEDHPRMCGEKVTTIPAGTLRLGSPPHVRGKDSVCHVYAALIGITPACAGKRHNAGT